MIEICSSEIQSVMRLVLLTQDSLSRLRVDPFRIAQGTQQDCHGDESLVTHPGRLGFGNTPQTTMPVALSDRPAWPSKDRSHEASCGGRLTDFSRRYMGSLLVEHLDRVPASIMNHQLHPPSLVTTRGPSRRVTLHWRSSNSSSSSTWSNVSICVLPFTYRSRRPRVGKRP